MELSKVLRTLLGVVAIAALIGVLSTFVVEASFTSRAQRVQLVTITPRPTSPLGPATTELGAPIQLIPGDPSPFLKNKTALGLPMVDANYLSKHPEAGVRLDNVLPVINLARIGSILACIVAVVGWIFWPLMNMFLSESQP